MNEEIKIDQVKIVKGKTLELHYEKTKADGTKTDVSEKHKAEVHSDLKSAMAGLNIHFAIISDFVSAKEITDIENVDNSLSEDFHVSAYSIGGDEDDEGVVLTGYKILKNGKALNMNTPFTRFSEKEETGYRFIDDLQTKIALVESEVRQYLTSGKKAPDNQTKIDFPESPDEGRVTHMQVAEPESQEDKDAEELDKLRAGRLNEAVTEKANPEAMDRVKHWDDPEKAGDMIENRKQQLRGGGKKKVS